MRPGELLSHPTVDGVRRWVTRYQPFLLATLAVALIAVLRSREARAR